MIQSRDWDFWCKEEIKRCGVVGVYIRSRRLHYKLTQQRLAKELGVTQVTLSKIEAGKYLPTANMVVKLAELFHCSESLFWDM